MPTPIGFLFTNSYSEMELQLTAVSISIFAQQVFGNLDPGENNI